MGERRDKKTHRDCARHVVLPALPRHTYLIAGIASYKVSHDIDTLGCLKRVGLHKRLKETLRRGQGTPRNGKG